MLPKWVIVSAFHPDASPPTTRRSPCLAILTEPDAVSTQKRMEETIHTLSQVMEDGFVDLISIRCVRDSNENNNDDNDDSDDDSFQKRVVELTHRLLQRREELFVETRTNSDISTTRTRTRTTSTTRTTTRTTSTTRTKRFPKIVINDNLDAVIQSNADGIHVKERNVDQIPHIRNILNQAFQSQSLKSQQSQSESHQQRKPMIGTSAHSMESAKRAFTTSGGIDYLFVGTCYITQSHPEKQTVDLEGPSLPGLVRCVFLTESNQPKEEEDGDRVMPLPTVFAIGGINNQNCGEPVHLGADGVAVIRSVMQADDPARASWGIYQRMMEESCQQNMKNDNPTFEEVMNDKL